MKKNWLGLLSLLCFGSMAFGLSACSEEGGKTDGWGTVYSFETAYAQAQELGYAGSLEEFIAQISGAKGEQGEQGIQGVRGEKGDGGVGVKKVEVNGEGNLLITLTDDTQIDCGKVVGKDGADGVGISSVYFNDKKELVVVYTDETEKVVGTIPVCDHIYGEWTVGEQATCTSIGYQYRTCTVCENVEYDFTEKLGHSFATNLLSANDYKHEQYCTRCYEIINSLHTYGDDTTCDICGNYYSSGLEFNLNNDGVSYWVSGIGTCTDTDVVVPAMHRGKFVTSIGTYAFEGCSSLTSITIPDSVTSIGEGAFNGCSSLTEITLPFIGATKDDTKNTFFGYIFGANGGYNNRLYVPTSLNTVTVKGGAKIGSYAFRGCSGLTNITIPDSVMEIGQGAFYGCSGLTSITIPDRVIAIEDYVFWYCSSLTRLSITNGQ